ncbi:MAG: acyl-CoA synthetase FdrA [Caldilineaceae bacterium]|nr:acyl-CoA synthetase FdrA [Caldilineaceae bacterium]
MLKTEVRSGAYYDSVILMQLQRGLAALPGIDDAGVVMGTPANKDVLAQSGLLTPAAQDAGADDLIIVVGGEDDAALAAALGQVDELLARRRGANAGDDYRPKSLDAAAKALPEAAWVLISVPGRYAAGVAEEALRLGKHVFLYSDNVTLDDEVRLKQTAAAHGLLVMGPDCGTAIVNGVGLGFANGVRSGNIGLVGASGTGLQHVTARIHQLGGGITHALGTGGRDLTADVGAITARQALDLLSRDPATDVIVLISKPPAPAVARTLLDAARSAGKPVIVNFIGYVPDAAMTTDDDDNLHFVRTLDGAAALAVLLAQAGRLVPEDATEETAATSVAPLHGYLRGLYSGGTLAYEALLILQEYLPAVYSNAPLDKRFRLEKATQSREHTIVDLGEDEFTVGRLHPMMDNDLRLQRLAQEAADPAVGVIVLDVVLGYGAHPDPAAELAPGIAQAIATAHAGERDLTVVAVVVGTDADPQDMDRQIAQLAAAGAQVYVNHDEAVRMVGARLHLAAQTTAADPAAGADAEPPPVALAALHAPLAAVNVGLESFTASLEAQGAGVVQVDWRPPAGGNERLAGILARMKRGG